MKILMSWELMNFHVARMRSNKETNSKMLCDDDSINLVSVYVNI